MEKKFTGLEIKQDPNAKSLSFFCIKDRVMISRDIMDQLVEESKKNGDCDIRISLHKSPDDDFHNMIILQNKNKYYRPHRHQKKVEVYQIIEGKMALFIFNDDGEVIESDVLSTEENFIYRIPAKTWHVTIPLTKFVIFHESKPGPFLREGDSIFANWAPDGSVPHEAKKYFTLLLKKVNTEPSNFS